MKKSVQCVAFVLALVVAASATIKLRYSVPRYHQYLHTIKAGDTLTVEGVLLQPTQDTTVILTGSPNGNQEFERTSYLDSAYLRAFDSYDANTVWDNAPIENVSSAPSVIDAVVWVDSMYEPRSDMGAYVLNVDVMRDSANAIASEGFIAFLFGGIRFPAAGIYTIITGGDDGGTPMQIDLDGDGTFEKQTGGIIKRDSMDVSLVPSFLDSKNWSKFRVMADVNVEANKFYKFMARYYNYSQVSNSGVFWKKPDGTIEPVGSSAFGARKQFGAPVAHIVKVLKEGTEIPQASWSFLEVESVPLTLIASADNMQGMPATYIWNFGDGSAKVTTTDSSATHTFFPKEGAFGFAPSVQVKRGDRLSRPNPETILVIPTSVRARQGIVRSDGFVRIEQGRLELSCRPGERLSAHVVSIRGATVARREIVGAGRSATIDFGRAFPCGTYLVRVARDGRAAGQGKMVVGK